MLLLLISSSLSPFLSSIRSDKLVLGGGLVFTFLKAKGISVGSSLVEEDFLPMATDLLAKAQEKGLALILPTDVLCADKFDNEVNSLSLRRIPSFVSSDY